MNTNSSALNPETEKAVATALGPGIGTTRRPASMCGFDESGAGIGDAWRAGVRHERN